LKLSMESAIKIEKDFYYEYVSGLHPRD
jgi:hypothetical protein